MEFLSVWIILLMLLSSSVLWVLAGIRWQSIRKFFHDNYSFFDISFIAAYFLEQFILILLLEFAPEEIVLWVSLFSLIVISTASIQKMTMDSRDKKLKELYSDKEFAFMRTNHLNHELIKENEYLNKTQEKLMDYIHRSKK